MEKNTPQPAWWHYRINGAHDGFERQMPPEDAYDEGTLTALYQSPPVPRDVLMAALDDLDNEVVDTHGIGMPFDLREEIADRYASKVQPEPVNQQLLAALKAFVADFEGCYADGEPAMIQARAAIAAEAAQPVGQHAGKFFTWDDETGFDLFDTKEEAKKAAQESIDLYRDLADCDGWPEAVENVCWGVVLGKTLEVELPVEGNPHAQLLGRNHYVDYVLTDCQQPASAQPVAVPEPKIGRTSDPLKLAYWDGWNTCREAMLSASQKPEGDA